MRFFELHQGLPREGPGDDHTTAAVLQSLQDYLRSPNVLDVGCGPGAQTLVLARLSGGVVTAVDRHQPFLDELMVRARAAGLANKVRPICASMEALPFEPGSFDLIWSEGAIYIVGFEAGLRAWRRFLRKTGFLVVSEATWLTTKRPEEARLFWADAYPAMTSLEENRRLIQAAGYEAVAEFILPKRSWFADYYDPLEKRIEELSACYASEAATLRWLEIQRAEIDICRRYADSFGYVFYVMRR